MYLDNYTSQTLWTWLHRTQQACFVKCTRMYSDVNVLAHWFYQQLLVFYE